MFQFTRMTSRPAAFALAALLLSRATCRRSDAAAFVVPPRAARPFATRAATGAAATSASSAETPGVEPPPGGAPEIAAAPTLNGKVVLPVRAATAGLRGHTVAAVYALLDSNYKRGSPGWEHVRHVSITRDLAADLAHFLSQKGPKEVAHLRALSFSYPQKAVMEDFAAGWRAQVTEAGGSMGDWGAVPKDAGGAAEAATIMAGDAYRPDEDEDEDEDDGDDDDLDHEDYLQMMSQSRPPPPASTEPLFTDNTGLTGITSLARPAPEGGNAKEDIISPFEKAVNAATAAVVSSGDDVPLELDAANVDKVLDEVRPYLISDGGNVAVKDVDADTGNVYLLLEGACGSCASSTVTMKMGIERVLREKFGTRLGEVVDATEAPTPGAEGDATELTLEAVQAEVRRISQAIIALGGVVRVVDVDPLGVVEIEYRGPNRVKKGLEMALLDMDFVKHVKFVS